MGIAPSCFLDQGLPRDPCLGCRQDVARSSSSSSVWERTGAANQPSHLLPKPGLGNGHGVLTHYFTPFPYQTGRGICNLFFFFFAREFLSKGRFSRLTPGISFSWKRHVSPRRNGVNTSKLVSTKKVAIILVEIM